MDADVTHTAGELAPQRVEETPRVAVATEAGWRRVAVWVAEHELWIVGAVAPLLMFPGRFPRFLILASLALLALVWPVRWIAWSRITLRTAFDVPILALLLMLPASLYASADFSTSLPKLTGILLGVAIFYAVVNTVTTRERMVQLSALLILVAVGVAGVSLVSTGWKGARFPLIPHLYQYLPTFTLGLTRTGTFNANQVGGTLILFIPLNLAWLYAVSFSGNTKVNREISVLAERLRNYRTIVIALLAISLLLMTATLMLTQSRSAVVGLGIALLFLLSVRNRRTATAFVLLIVLALVGIWWVGPANVGRLLLDVAGEGAPVGSLTFAGRQEVWSRAVYMLQDFPYTGVGLGMFEQVAHVLYPFFLIGPDAVVVHAHNVYLQVGVDLGLPGLVAYIGLITAFCAVAWRAGRRAPTRHMRAMALGLLGGVIAYHVYGLTDAMTLGAKPGAALWAMFGLAAALDHRRAQSTIRSGEHA